MVIFPKGHVFVGPEGQGYTVGRDLHLHTPIFIEDLLPFGGAPIPKEDEEMVWWLFEYLNRAGETVH